MKISDFIDNSKNSLEKSKDYQFEVLRKKRKDFFENIIFGIYKY